MGSCCLLQPPLVIHNPHALPLFREDRPGGKRKREKDRADPIKSRAPERGSGGAASLKPGTGGEIGATGGTLLTQYILKNQARAVSCCVVQAVLGVHLILRAGALHVLWRSCLEVIELVARDGSGSIHQLLSMALIPCFEAFVCMQCMLGFWHPS